MRESNTFVSSPLAKKNKFPVDEAKLSFLCVVYTLPHELERTIIFIKSTMTRRVCETTVNKNQALREP